MELGRMMRHLLLPRWLARRYFPARSMEAIARAIRESEQTHLGELRFAVETALDIPQLLRGITARQRALEVFSQLRVWDTEHNSGVLIYLLLADRRVEIVADRGIHARAGDQEWGRICAMMEAMLREARFEEAVLAGVREISEQLRRHFPAEPGNPNELPDEVVIL